MSKVSEIDIYQKQLKIKFILYESQLISLSNETKFSLLTGYKIESWESIIL